MRKGQVELLEKAHKRGFSKVLIDELSRDDLSLTELKELFYLFRLCCNKDEIWLKTFINIDDFHVMQLIAHNKDIISDKMLCQIATEKDIYQFFLHNGIVCENLFDVEVVILSGFCDYTTVLLDFVRRLRDELLKIRKLKFSCECDAIEIAKKISDTLKLSDEYEFFFNHIDFDKLLADVESYPYDFDYINWYTKTYLNDRKVLENGDESDFCEDLFEKLVNLFNDETLYKVTHRDTVKCIDIVPKKIDELLNMDCGQYLQHAMFCLNDKVQHIQISLDTQKGSGVKYVSIALYSVEKRISVNFEHKSWFIIDAQGSRLGKLMRTILIYGSDKVNTVYSRNGKKYYYPTTVSDLKFAPPVLCEFIMHLFAGNSMIWKDFCKESFYPPIKLCEIQNYHNKREFCEKQFGIKLRTSVNRLSFKRLYAACCAQNYVILKQIPFLFDGVHDIDFDFLPSRRDKKRIAFVYLKWYLKNIGKLAAADYDEICNVLNDYLEFAERLNEPVDIRMGKHKLFREHDRLADIIIIKSYRGKKLVVPETPLKYLKLPNEFCLLKTKESLILEGRRNHNCVGGYIDYINRGKCVVYTADIGGEHLTIEVSLRKHKNGSYSIYVNQCFKSYNRPCQKSAQQYVIDCVTAAQDAAIEKYSKITANNLT